MNFWDILMLNMSLMNDDKVRFLSKTSFPNWDKHGKDILGGKEELREINGYFQNAVLFLHNSVCVVADSDIFNSVRCYKGMEFFSVLNHKQWKWKSEVLVKLSPHPTLKLL